MDADKLIAAQKAEWNQVPQLKAQLHEVTAELHAERRARTQTEQRKIDVQGLTLAFSLTSAAVGDAVFSVGYASLDETVSPAKAQMLVDAFAQALYRRVGQSVPAQGAAGEVFTLETDVNGRPSRLMGRVLVHRGMLIQVVVSGPTQSLSRENASEFMRSLVLR
jgi:hypothetical protein